MNPNRAWTAAAVLLLTAVSFWWFPGHTILQADTQIYIPILQHLENPRVLARDAMAVRPHVAFTLYDEIALALRRVTGLGFENVLLSQQVLFRCLSILGVFLLARSAGISSPLSLAAAALLALGATVNGPQVLTVEYEPVPRGFAFALVLLALGLAARSVSANSASPGAALTRAALASAAAFAYHPPTALPVWLCLTALFVFERRWRELAVAFMGPLLIAVSLLAHKGTAEALPLTAPIGPALEAILRMRASYNWVDTWIGRYWMHYSLLFAAAIAGAWRIRFAMTGPAGIFLWALPLLGALSVPVSWLLIDHGKWLVGPQFQPGRYLLYVPFFAALNCTIAGLRAAATGGRFAEAALFLVVPFAIPLAPDLFALKWSGIALAAALALALALALAYARKPIVAVAPVLLAFALYPTWGGVVNFPRVDSAELEELAVWARGATSPDAVFQFADVRRGLEPGIFRARAERAIYADWKAGGQVNFLPEFAHLWADRWKLTERPQPYKAYRGLGIDYLVLQVDKAPKGLNAVYKNDAVYKNEAVYKNRGWVVLRIQPGA